MFPSLPINSGRCDGSFGSLGRFSVARPLGSRAMTPTPKRPLLLGRSLGLAAAAFVLVGARAQAAPIPWSRQPPGGLAPAQVPQFVAVTFDDGYGLEDG